MARATFWQQLKALIRRNLLLKQRCKQQTAQEFLLPIYFILLLAAIRYMSTPEERAAITNTNAYPLSTFPVNTSKVLYISPNTSAVRDAASRLAVLLELSTKPVFFDNPEQAESTYLSNAPTVLAGIDFATPFHDLNYTLRFPPNQIASTKLFYSTQDQCREDAGLQKSVAWCMANTYLYSSFASIQVALDTILIQMTSTTPGPNVSMPSVSVQLFPKSKWLPNTYSLQILASIYFVLAYSIYISFLTVTLVSEKEKKIKEAMRMMGMKDSAFWLSWGLVYAVIILIVTIIVTLLAHFLGFFQNSNIFIFFIMLMLYGLSIINLAFALTPFFNRAETSGAMASLATILFSLLYLVVLVTQDSSGQSTLPTWAIYLLCLLSPFALSLSVNQAIILDIAYGGMNFTTITIGTFPLSSMLTMLAVDVVLYGLLAFYFDNVIPNEYGLARPPWFFVLPAYWRRPRTRYLEEVGLWEHGEYGVNETPAVTMDMDKMEAVPPEFRNRNLLRIFDMQKVYKNKGKEVRAVNGISLDIYEGQITALIGHNGAGKTTLLHMLTGMSPATSGSATIYGLDVSDRNEMTELRTMIGLCPQHNILFDDLTPREHLQCYGNLKGIPENRVNTQVGDALRMLNLSDQADTMSKHLSGGQKRKLCVAIALIGDPKVVFLDEPTAGMDPSSRRQLWQLLKRQQKDKLIVLTTHFMDEADILADRKAIISKGQLQCVGSSLFLKNRFGIGYHLSMVLEPSADVNLIENVVKSHVMTAKTQRQHGAGLTFILPMASVSAFPKLFGSLEEKVDGLVERSSQLGIHSYGVSMTSLEEVFLKFGEEAEAEDNLAPLTGNTHSVQTPLNYTDARNVNYATSTIDSYGGQTRSNTHLWPASCRGDGQVSLTESELAMQRIKALMKIRLLLLIRNIPRFIFQVIFPILYMIAGGVVMLSLPALIPAKTTSLRMQPKMYAGSTVNTRMPSMIYNLSDSADESVRDFNVSLHNQGLMLTSFTDIPSLLKTAPHNLGLAVDTVNATTQVVHSVVTVLYNDTAIHSLPAALNVMMSTLLKMTRLANPIVTFSKPWPWLDENPLVQGATFGTALLLGIALSSIPAGFGSTVARDRISKTKSQLRLAGVSMNMYWGTVFAFDAIQLTAACLLMLFIVLAFQISSMSTSGAVLCIILCYIGYIPSNMFLSYNLSYLYNKIETAQSSLPNIFIFSSMGPFFIMSVLDMTGQVRVAIILHYIFSIFFPAYPIMGILYFIDKVYHRMHIVGGKPVPIPISAYFATDSHILITILMPLVHMVVLYFLLSLNDLRSTGASWRACLSCYRNMITFSNAGIDSDLEIPENEDVDVATERRRVRESEEDALSTTQHVIRVNSLRKEFTRNQKTGCCQRAAKLKGKLVAVRNSSFLVEPGEIFGLLGPNGAGKTTVLNMIIAETAPTSGKVTVAGHDMEPSVSSALHTMGYCPQHDPLWDFISLREHLQCYAAIRGIPEPAINGVIMHFMQSLDIVEHADKIAKNLSGGTKRKLSYIMGIIGEPKVVLMDEPSTGLDPKSKRFLWDTIATSFNDSRRGAILTTHYMEEADALCSRVAIMINGQLECLGSIQHLKNKFGGGYQLEVKLQATVNAERSEANMKALQGHLKNAFPEAVCQELFGDRVQYRVPHTSIISLADTFNKLEQAKATFSVEEYSFSQATLEQVFLEFAKHQEVGEADPLRAGHSASMTRSLHRHLSLHEDELIV